jgi:hypothetical protein
MVVAVRTRVGFSIEGSNNFKSCSYSQPLGLYAPAGPLNACPHGAYVCSGTLDGE